MKKRLLVFACAAVTVAAVIAVSVIPIKPFGNSVFDGHIKSILLYAVCIPWLSYLIKTLGYKPFGKPVNAACFFVALLVAVNNFPFFPFFKGNSYIVNSGFAYVAVFVVYCAFTAAFEELLFRGILFGVIYESSKKTKYGALKAIALSSVAFGLAHFLNLLGGAGFMPTLMQVGYTTLIGALCAFVWFKTRNLVFPWLIHAVYNVCGLLLSSSGIGNGIYFDTETVVITAVIGVFVGVFALLTMLKRTDDGECADYARTVLGIKEEKNGKSR